MTLLPGIDPFPSDKAARVKASSAWYTPPAVAAEMARMCFRPKPQTGPWRILEPSAGGGALIDALDAEGSHGAAILDAVELDPIAAEGLRAKWGHAVNVECCDYLDRPSPTERYDLGIANSPYEKGMDSAFIAKMMNECDRIVALVRLALLESQRSHSRVWSRIGNDGWRLIELRIYSERPVFLPGGEPNDDGGKTAFAIVKLSRVSGDPTGGTHVGWL